MWEQGSSGERRRRGEVGGGKERREEVEGRRGAGEEGTGGGEGWGRAGERSITSRRPAGGQPGLNTEHTEGTAAPGAA